VQVSTGAARENRARPAPAGGAVVMRWSFTSSREDDGWIENEVDHTGGATVRIAPEDGVRALGRDRHPAASLAATSATESPGGSATAGLQERHVLPAGVDLNVEALVEHELPASEHVSVRAGSRFHPGPARGPEGGDSARRRHDGPLSCADRYHHVPARTLNRQAATDGEEGGPAQPGLPEPARREKHRPALAILSRLLLAPNGCR